MIPSSERPRAHRWSATASTLCFCALAVAATSCIEVRTTSCADLVCPADRVCSEAHGRCVLDEQVGACASASEGDPCAYPGVSDGRCFDGVCFATGCGNGVLEPGEVCDDGRTVDGDGCSADCRSDESCGNDVIDVEVGERCDDGNVVDGDGCQADCSLPRCGDGVVDEGEACDDGNDEPGDGCNPQCTSDETCGNGVIDVFVGEECDDGNVAVGDGCGATCRIEACGNGILDPGEVCDDENLLSGDGCSATCLSLEVCGNGVVDPLNGEACDDGGHRSQDGCSSACTVEFPVWTELVLGEYPPRNHAAAVYDPVNRRTIMFGGWIPGGGSTGTALNDTWAFDGNSWRQIVTAHAPEARYQHAMAYDASRRTIVLFGGVSPRGAGGRDDTWEFDGVDWTRRSFGSPPSDGVSPEMTYDAAREQIVLVTEGGSSPALETWTYDGLRWTLAATTGPPRRNHPNIAYHGARRSVFVAGGLSVTGPHRDLWEWDGASWTEHTGSEPSGTAHLAYDAQRNRLVALGGRFNAGSVSVWDGAWSDLDTPNRPPARFFSAMTYDADRGVILVFGGDEDESPGDPVSFTDTWALGDDDWYRPASSPFDRAYAGATFDERRGRPVVVGGLPNDIFFDPFFEDTWELIDGAWVRVQSTLPFESVPSWGATVYDPGQQLCLITPTLEYDGNTWRDVGPPGPSGANQTAFDRARGVPVLISGEETWELVGGAWTRIATSGTPPPGQAVYDRAGGRVLLIADTVWVYDPSVSPPTWTDTGLSGPPSGGAVAYDSRLEQVVVFGAGGVNDTWTFDGREWTQRIIPTAPAAPGGAVFMDDPVNRRMLLIGGFEADRSTWQLAWTSGSPQEVCDAPGDEDGDGLDDCADPDCESAFCADDGMQCDDAGACVCPGGSVEARCGDAWDDDCDGDVDCDDSDCASSAYCGAEIDCGDGVDDDGDGRVDCADPGCTGSGVCEAFERSCGDGEDNDGDGRVDCQDVDCFLAPCASVLP